MPVTQTPAPTGPYMKPLLRLAEMLAGLASVQARFETSGDLQATFDKIALPVLERDQLHPALPGIVLTLGDRWSMPAAAGGAQTHLHPANSGSSIRMILADKAKYPELQPSFVDFGNWIGAVLLGLAAISGVDTNLNIINVRQELPIAGCSKEEERSVGLWLMASFFVDWN